MALLSISAAARAAGRDRGTIKRYIDTGKISTTEDATGRTVVDTAELMRVFGELKSQGDVASAVQSEAKQQHNIGVVAVLQQELQAAREREKAALERERQLNERLDAALEHNRELELKMLPLGEVKKGFWARVFGK
jgi:predicted site-specific integrase-resolvase